MHERVLLEMSHFHFPLYIKDLLDEGIKVVGFWAKSERIRAKYSKPFRCNGYNDWEEILGSCSDEVAFAFGEHDEMYSDPMYGIYVQEFCQAVRNSKAFASDLKAMKTTMKIIDAA